MLKIKSVKKGSIIVKYDIVVPKEITESGIDPEQLLSDINDK